MEEQTPQTNESKDQIFNESEEFDNLQKQKLQVNLPEEVKNDDDEQNEESFLFTKKFNKTGINGSERSSESSSEISNKTAKSIEQLQELGLEQIDLKKKGKNTLKSLVNAMVLSATDENNQDNNNQQKDQFNNFKLNQYYKPRPNNIFNSQPQQVPEVEVSLESFDVDEAPLDQGAFGVVYKAEMKSTKQKVVIKQLKKETVDPIKIMRERDILLQMQHQNVAKMIAKFQDEENIYFVLELVENGNMENLLKKHKTLGEDLTKIYVAQMVNLLEYMQKKDIMHRDLKPLNIMLDQNYNIKLIDFGDAKIMQNSEDSASGLLQADQSDSGSDSEEEEEDIVQDNEEDEAMAFQNDDDDQSKKQKKKKKINSRIRTASMVGTYNYLTPEVILKEKHTPGIDVWALGCIMFKMLVGKVAFPGTLPYQVCDSIKNRRIKWPEEDEIKNLMSDEAQDLIGRMIQINPDDRLGYPLSNITKLRNHKFFKGIDFKEVSSPQYTGALKHIEKLDQILQKNNEQNIEKQIIESQPQFEQSGESNVEKKMRIKGSLYKKNNLGINQKRLFELYDNGDLIYFKHANYQFVQKGVLKIDHTTQFIQVNDRTIKFKPSNKKTDYTLIQLTDDELQKEKQIKKQQTLEINLWLNEFEKIKNEIEIKLYPKDEQSDNIYEQLERKNHSSFKKSQKGLPKLLSKIFK